VRRGLNFKIVTKEFGGEVATSGEIGNWPGINKIDGFDLSKKFKEHLEFYEAGIEEGVEVSGIRKQNDGVFCVMAKNGQDDACDYLADAVIVATGVHPKELNIPGEKEFRSKGLSYCTTCDGPLFKGKVTVTIGGGNSALESALTLSDISSKVYVINKNPRFKGETVLLENLQRKQNVEIIYEALTSEISGEQFVKGLKYKNKEGEEQELTVDGVFVHIGQIPNSDIVSDNVEKNTFKEIKVNDHCETNVEGLYAAGDVTSVPFKQIVIAAAQGCIATLSAVQYLNKLKK
jgi:thioredoxin reductase